MKPTGLQINVRLNIYIQHAGWFFDGISFFFFCTAKSEEIYKTKKFQLKIMQKKNAHTILCLSQIMIT